MKIVENYKKISIVFFCELLWKPGLCFIQKRKQQITINNVLKGKCWSLWLNKNAIKSNNILLKKYRGFRGFSVTQKPLQEVCCRFITYRQFL